MLHTKVLSTLLWDSRNLTKLILKLLHEIHHVTQENISSTYVAYGGNNKKEKLIFVGVGAIREILWII